MSEGQVRRRRAHRGHQRDVGQRPRGAEGGERDPGDVGVRGDCVVPEKPSDLGPSGWTGDEGGGEVTWQIGRESQK